MIKLHTIIVTFLLVTVAALLAGCPSQQRQQHMPGGTTSDMPAQHEQAGEQHPGPAMHEGEHHEHEVRTYDNPDELALSGQLMDGVREVQVEAFRYGFQPDPVVVKQGEKVRIIATSRDVAHGLGIDQFGVDENIEPGEETVVEFTPDHSGQFLVHCTVYCGPGHEDMQATLIVQQEG